MNYVQMEKKGRVKPRYEKGMKTDRHKAVAAGVCLGASTVSVVKIEQVEKGYRVMSFSREPHFGEVFGTLKRIAGQSSLAGLPCCVTGRNVRKGLGLPSISEPEAVELSVKYFLPESHPYRVVISAGGEGFVLYHLDERGCVQQLYSGNKCASGTGEFFLQQLHRMNLSLDDIKDLPPAATPYHVSGRCSVFCKSDCTHALNKGIDKASVVLGLAEMMAEKIEELFRKIPKSQAVLIGGCVLNKGLTAALGRRIADLYVPPEATYFEALGAAIRALQGECSLFPDPSRLQFAAPPLQSDLAPLGQFEKSVTFSQLESVQANTGDRLLLGLDVGSTTTKGVLVQAEHFGVVASSYQRTNGDPVRAARNVYTALGAQLKVPVEIVGLGVTGSGRQIAGLHAGATCVVNEIIAHATGAAHFDREVDTILEIGGQDAKYIRLINGVPNDYAMNEACSAGTGSFLEESAKESLGLDYTEIGDIALGANNPANFNDQCSAFIGSDIKNAVQQHITTPDIVAGLVYSIGANYINRVVGNRPIGRKIFVQGGVCYNRAVPAALAALTGKQVVVPPDPGLMGALGIALEMAGREKLGMVEYGRFNLDKLSRRDVRYGKPFICNGGGEGCDRKCEIAMIEIEGKKLPFGGVCNRYDNLAAGLKSRSKSLNGVVLRQRLIFADTAPARAGLPTVKMNRSLLVNSLFPFYRTFFEELGCAVVLPDAIDKDGVAQRGAPFCYPVEIAHGYMPALLEIQADYLFSPLLKGVSAGSEQNLCTCVFVQSEPYYLSAAFPDMKNERLLNPVLDFSDEKKSLRNLQEVAVRMGFSKVQGKRSFLKALEVQRTCEQSIRDAGAVLLNEIESDDERIGIVLFGRPYSAFADEANKGIPLKFAARGATVIPYDMISFDHEKLADGHNMYWAMGSILLRCAQYVAKHPRLYGTFVTNFSCGPDSFVVTYFRDIMGTKPSLTLELDSHTADAGIETRIEAFLDIVRARRRINPRPSFSSPKGVQGSNTASVEFIDGRNYFRRANGELVPFSDRRVKVMIPSMTRFGTLLLARAFARSGMHAEVVPPADSEMLKMGKGASSCKECLPLHTTLGSLLHYVRNKKPEGELTVYFMPSAPGPCRFGQYHVFMKRAISQEGFEDVAVFSPTSENCYGGMDSNDSIAAWRGIVIGDLFDEMWSTILTAAVQKEEALEILNETHARIAECVSSDWKTLRRCLHESAKRLSSIQLMQPYEAIPKISLVGEIYVRHDPISLQNLVERMAERGFIVRTAQNSEWMKYLDWLINNKILGKKTLSFRIGRFLKERADSRIRKILSPCGLFYHADMRVEPVVRSGLKFMSPHFQSEAILTVGAAFHDILSPACGVISIGPFGCMPSRVAEAVLTEKFTVGEKTELTAGYGEGFLPCPGRDRKLPFLAIETDGKPFPPLIEARIEAFCLQAERLHKEILLPLN